MKTIRSVTVGSAFKVGAVLSALLFAVLGIFILLLPGLFGASLPRSIIGGYSDPVSALGVDLVIYLIGVVAYGVIGGIGGAIYAFLYNLVADVVGGLEIDID